MKVVILHDALSPDARPDELDSLVQAESITRALQELGHEPVPLSLTLDLKRAAQRLGEYVRLEHTLAYESNRVQEFLKSIVAQLESRLVPDQRE